MVSGIDQYSYDGDDFLSFDSDNKQWVAHMFEAMPTKRKWDGIQQLNDYTDGYLHNECVQWLETFLKYRKEANIKACKCGTVPLSCNLTSQSTRARSILDLRGRYRY
jgi:hypothetical protein